jgi:hypothetical protein
MTTAATAGSGCELRRGGGGSTGVRASKTVGTSNQQIVLFWGATGTAGNSKTAAIVVSGNNTAFSISVSTSAVSITSATDGSGVATTTVAQAIAALYADATFRDNWDVTTGVGTGSGVLVASSSSSLSGGTGETFTAIAEVKGVRGPSLSGGIIDVTSFDSANSVREFIATLRDPGTLSFTVNYLPANSGHAALLSDLRDGLARNFQLQFSDLVTTYMSFTGVVTGAEISAELEQAISANVTIKLTGWPEWVN